MPSPPRGPAKAKVLQVKAIGEKIPANCRASVQLCTSTPYRDSVMPEMLISQRPYFTWPLPVLNYLALATCCSPQKPRADLRAGGCCLPQLMGTKSPLLTHKEKKKNPTALKQPRGALACLKVLYPAASSSQPRQADLEDRQILKHKELPGS